MFTLLTYCTSIYSDLNKGVFMTDNIYVSYNGSQLGFSIRNFALEQKGYCGTGIDANSIAAGLNEDVYLTSNNHIYHYNINGELIKDMCFPDSNITYTGVVVKGDKVYATYDGSQRGVTIRDLNLNQVSYIDTGVHATGIAAGSNDDLYITAANHVYHYKTDGTLLKDMCFPDTGINYTDVSVFANTVYISYMGSQQGVSIRSLELEQLSWMGTNFNINAIAAAPDNSVYLTSANHVYHYKLDGTLVKDMAFPSTSINYTGISMVFSVTT